MFRIIFLLVKLTSLVLGFYTSMISLMALVGYFFDNLLIQAGAAAVVVFVIPLLIANQFIPKDEASGLGKGVISDTYALVWLAIGTLLIGALLPLTSSAFENEAELLDSGGHNSLAAVTRLLTGSVVDPRVKEAAIVESSPPVAAKPSADAGLSEDAAIDPEPKEKTKPTTKKESVAETKKLTPAEIFHIYAPSVVTVSVRTKGRPGSGTGFILDGDGTIATNHHVVEGARHVRIKLFDGTWVEDVELLTADAKDDLALLKIKTKSALKPVLLGNSSSVTVGEKVVSIGNPLGLDHTLTDGLVSARRVWRGQKMIQMSAPVSPGNSGGPLFNATGEVIGVTTAKLGNAWNRGDSLNLAVPVDLLKQMLRPDYPRRKTFGVTTW